MLFVTACAAEWEQMPTPGTPLSGKRCPSGYQEVARTERLCAGEPPLALSCEWVQVFDHCEAIPDAPAVLPGVTPDSDPASIQCGPTHQDDTDCTLDGTGGGGTLRSPRTCLYHCDGIEHMIILPVGMMRCPGEATYTIRWKTIKGFQRRY